MTLATQGSIIAMQVQEADVRADQLISYDMGLRIFDLIIALSNNNIDELNRIA